jgi:hypothetical protein
MSEFSLAVYITHMAAAPTYMYTVLAHAKILVTEALPVIHGVCSRIYFSNFLT